MEASGGESATGQVVPDATGAAGAAGHMGQTGRLVPWLHVVLLASACFVVYSNAYDHAYQLDSIHTVHENRSVRSLGEIPGYFADATTASTLLSNVDYRPVLMVSYALNYWWSGYEMSSWHFVQILLHASCVLGLYFVGLGLLRRGSGAASKGAAWLAFIAALIFAVQPTAAGVVDYLSARSSLLAAAFMFMAILVYMGRGPGERRRFWTWWSALPFALALFTKVEAVACLAVFLMLEAWDRRRDRGRPSSLVGDVLGSLRGTTAVRLAPHLVIVLAYFVIRSRLMADLPFAESSKQAGLTAWHYLLTQTVAWWYYVGNWFAPFGLVADHGAFTVQRSITEPAVLLAVGGWALVATLLISQWRPRPGLVVAGVAGLALISPTSSIVPLAEMVNEHRPYMPIAVLSLCWMLPLGGLWGLIQSRLLRAGAVLALVVIVVALGRQTLARNEVFLTEESYWKDIIEKQPSWRAHTNYGRTLMAKSQYPEALEHLLKTLDTAPYWYIVHVNLGVTYHELGQEELAARHYDLAVKYDRYTATGLIWRGEFRLGQKRYAEALADYQACLEKSRDYFRCYKGIATAQAGLGNAEAAYTSTLECLELEPLKTPLHITQIAGPFFEAPERYEAGISFFEHLGKQLPDAWWIYENIATLATRLGREGEASAMRARSAELKAAAESS